MSGDVSCDESYTKTISSQKGFDERNDILVKTRFLAIDFRQRGDQLRALLLAKLLLEVFRKLLDSTKILEQVPTFLKALKVTDIHVVTGECPFDCRECIDCRAVRIENDKLVLAVHAANLATRRFSFVTGQAGYAFKWTACYSLRLLPIDYLT